MEKRITNIYDFSNYRLLLNTDFAKRVAFNQAYSLRSYAKDLDISVGYLSKIINGKKELTHDKGRDVFNKMGFEEDELDYVENLIILNTTKDFNTKIEAKKKLIENPKRHRLIGKYENVAITNSTEHFITYALVRSISNIEDIYQISSQFKISRDKIEIALNTFIEEGYVYKENGLFFVTEKDFDIIRGHDNFCEFGYEMATFFYNRYLEQGLSNKENEASCLVLGLDEHTLKEVYELQEHYILSMLKISERSKKDESFIFLNTLLLEKKLSSNINLLN